MSKLKLSKKLKKAIKDFGGKRCLRYLKFFQKNEVFKNKKHKKRVDKVLYSLNKVLAKELDEFIHFKEIAEENRRKLDRVTTYQEYDSCGSTFFSYGSCR